VQRPAHDLLDKDDKEVSLTFAKGLSVLLAFHGKERELSISEIAQRTGLNRAVTRRLVRTLEQLGYVSQDRGRFQLTPRVLRLTHGFMEARSIPQVVQPVLRAAAQEIGESVSLSMLDGDEAIYVAQAFVPGRFSLNAATIGTRVPLVPTAIGRAMLAFLDKARRDAILDRLAAGEDRGALHDRRSFLDLLNLIRISGFSVTSSEYVEGVSSLAVPVLSAGGEAAGAVSIIFPQGQYSEEEIQGRLKDQLTKCAQDVSGVF
jgi:Transcriptional regulator